MRGRATMTTCMSSVVSSGSRASALIDLAALAHNLRVAQTYSSSQTLLPVIKANGYGHGLEAIAGALMAVDAPLAGCAIASLSEAQRLRENAWVLPIVLLPGFVNAAELEECESLELEPVIHSPYQVDLLLTRLKDSTPFFSRVWLKANTGMNRLGMNAEQWRAAYHALTNAGLSIVAMSHLACADELDSAMSEEQEERFAALTNSIDSNCDRSLAASGGILAWPSSHHDIVRPGIMLYGSSPFGERSAEGLGLEPVMTLRSRLLAINEIQAGDAVGYGASFVAEKAMRIGVVSIGYGDGYPRKTPNGTPVLVHTHAGMQRVPLVGRVSMDMITVDLTDIDASVGAEVVLWGEGLAADEIAQCCGTIAYELFCQVTARVPRVIKN